MLKSYFGIFLQPRHRTFVLGNLCFALIALALVGYQVFESYNGEVKRAERDAVNLSQVLEQHANLTFEKIDLVLKGINQVVEMHGDAYPWTPERWHELLKKTAESVPEVLSVNVARADGFYSGESRVTEPSSKANIEDRDYFQEQKNSPDIGLLISEPVLGKSTNEWIIVLSRRLYSSDKKFKGLVLASIPIDYFEKLFAKINLGEHGNVALYSMHTHGLLARYPRIESRLGKSFTPSPAFAAALSGTEPTGSFQAFSKVDNLDKTYGYAINHDFQFGVLTGIARTDYLAAWENRIGYVIFGTFLFLFGGILFLRHFLAATEALENQRLHLVESAKLSLLGEMAGGVAHEINNPLAIIKGRSGIIKRRLQMPNPDPASIVPMLDLIETTVDRISKIIAGLRTFARQSDNDDKLTVGLQSVVNGSLALCAEKFRHQRVQLKVQDIPEVYVLAREAQLSQVLLNLLSNSFDAAMEQNEKWIEISFAQVRGDVQIFITDSGAGISKEIEKKMMNPFFTNKPVGKGTGLGLSIAKGIVDDHGGKLYLNRNSSHTQFVCEFKTIAAPAVESAELSKKSA